MRVHLEKHFVSGRVDQFQPFGEPAVLLVQLNVGNMEEGKIATAWAQFARLKEVHQCI
jgi:hypothetical protein